MKLFLIDGPPLKSYGVSLYCLVQADSMGEAIAKRDAKYGKEPWDEEMNRVWGSIPSSDTEAVFDENGVFLFSHAW